MTGEANDWHEEVGGQGRAKQGRVKCRYERAGGRDVWYLLRSADLLHLPCERVAGGAVFLLKHCVQRLR